MAVSGPGSTVQRSATTVMAGCGCTSATDRGTSSAGNAAQAAQCIFGISGVSAGFCRSSQCPEAADAEPLGAGEAVAIPIGMTANAMSKTSLRSVDSMRAT